MPTCRELKPDGWPSLRWRKDGGERKTNRYPTTCHLCGDRLEPGEAITGQFDRAANRIVSWSCGPGRWQRP